MNTAMFGVTHDRATGQPIIRVPRVLKVGIGIPKGRAISIYIHRGKWIVRFGAWQKVEGKDKFTMVTKLKDATREQAEEYYRLHRDEAPVSNRPQKLPFFTFTKRTLVEEAGKQIEVFEPDFAAIEAHGETPREVDIVIMSDNAYHGEFQMWSATELKCHGDGVNALRVMSMGNDTIPGWKEAKEAGLRMFPIQPCWTDGCPYASESVDANNRVVAAQCKPGVTLNFQLANNMRLGATAYFHTTSIRSTTQIFSALSTIKTIAERSGASIVGLPLKMVLTPFRSNHNGQPATQYGVSLELRAEDMKTLRSRFAESVWTPKQIAEAPITLEPEEILTDASAPAVAAEFYPDEVVYDEEEPEASAPDASGGAKAATDDKTAKLADKLKAEKERKGNGAAPSAAPTGDAPPPPKQDLF